MKRTRSSDSLTGGEEEEVILFSGELPPSSGEKKRRLNTEQVRALEKNFEMENKLDPERKLRIALDIGLQPRQVAVWFQNRRARWKTKQLERDFAALRNSHEALAVNCESLRRDKEILQAEIREFKAKLGMKEEESECKMAKGINNGSSDSDTSAVVYDEKRPQSLLVGSAFDFDLSSEWKVQRSFFPKEEHNFLCGEEHSSDLFSNEQNPVFTWYCSDHWS